MKGGNERERNTSILKEEHWNLAQGAYIHDVRAIGLIVVGVVSHPA